MLPGLLGMLALGGLCLYLLSAQVWRDADARKANASRENSAKEERTEALRAEAEALAKEQVQAAAQLEELKLLLLSPMERAPADRAEQVRRITERVRWLRKTFQTEPQLQIPEMALLTDLDWLVALRFADLSTEEGLRKAMASVRTEAKRRFQGKLSTAVKKYVSAIGDVRPESVQALIPYFKDGVDLAMLQRREVAGLYASMMESAVKSFQIQDRVPVDRENDTFMALSGDGMTLRISGQNMGGIKSVSKNWSDTPLPPVNWATYLLKQSQSVSATQTRER